MVAFADHATLGNLCTSYAFAERVRGRERSSVGIGMALLHEARRRQYPCVLPRCATKKQRHSGPTRRAAIWNRAWLRCRRSPYEEYCLRDVKRGSFRSAPALSVAISDGSAIA